MGATGSGSDVCVGRTCRDAAAVALLAFGRCPRGAPGGKVEMGAHGSGEAGAHLDQWGCAAVALMAPGRCPAWGGGRDGGDGCGRIGERCARAGPVGTRPRWRSWPSGDGRRGAPGGMVEMGGSGSGSDVRTPDLSGSARGGAHGLRALPGVGRRAGWWRWVRPDQGAVCAGRACRGAALGESGGRDSGGVVVRGARIRGRGVRRGSSPGRVWRPESRGGPAGAASRR